MSRDTTRRSTYINTPLMLGSILVGLVTLTAIVGPWLAPHDPLERTSIVQDREGEWHVAPFAPLAVPGFPLGTDYIGRDTLSRLLWAVRPTLVLAVLIATTRLVLGVILGYLGGWNTGTPLGDNVVGGLTATATAIPVIVVPLLLLRLQTHWAPIWFFVITLSATGWGTAAQLVGERVRGIRKEGYIEAARALGATDSWIMVKHILPQLRTLMPIVLAFELSAALLQMAELGFLGLYFGGAETFATPVAGTDSFRLQPVPGQPELGQMLSEGWANVILMPWFALIASTCFFLVIFSFALLGEGLKRLSAEQRRPPALSGGRRPYVLT